MILPGTAGDYWDFPLSLLPMPWLECTAAPKRLSLHPQAPLYGIGNAIREALICSDASGASECYADGSPVDQEPGPAKSPRNPERPVCPWRCLRGSPPSRRADRRWSLACSHALAALRVGNLLSASRPLASQVKACSQSKMKRMKLQR